MNCKMLLIGEAWGREEEELAGRTPNNAFVGQAGKLLFEMLGAAAPQLEPELHAEAMQLARRDSTRWLIPRDRWLEDAGICYANVLNMRPPDNKMSGVCISKDEFRQSENYPPWHSHPIAVHPKALYLQPKYLHHVDALHKTLNFLQPKLVVALGNTACWATLCATNIGSIRGAITKTSHPAIDPSIKLLPIYHPAALLHSAMKGAMSKPVCIADFIKAFRECEFPEVRRPVRWVTVNPTIEECEQWVCKISQLVAQREIEWLSCDIETEKRLIKCISFAPSDCEALVIPFWDGRSAERYWPNTATELRAWDCVSDLLALPVEKLGQNFLYDLQYLMEAPLAEPIYMGPNGGEDSMLLHHSWYPEMPKSLGFMASVYTNEASWKLMRRRRPDSDKRDE